jgi:hypothetical protein
MSLVIQNAYIDLLFLAIGNYSLAYWILYGALGSPCVVASRYALIGNCFPEADLH